jgi:hypothetical protein
VKRKGNICWCQNSGLGTLIEDNTSSSVLTCFSVGPPENRQRLNSTGEASQMGRCLSYFDGKQRIVASGDVGHQNTAALSASKLLKSIGAHDMEVPQPKNAPFPTAISDVDYKSVFESTGVALVSVSWLSPNYFSNSHFDPRTFRLSHPWTGSCFIATISSQLRQTIPSMTSGGFQFFISSPRINYTNLTNCYAK